MHRNVPRSLNALDFLFFGLTSDRRFGNDLVRWILKSDLLFVVPTDIILNNSDDCKLVINPLIVLFTLYNRVVGYSNKSIYIEFFHYNMRKIWIESIRNLSHSNTLNSFTYEVVTDIGKGHLYFALLRITIYIYDNHVICPYSHVMCNVTAMWASATNISQGALL